MESPGIYCGQDSGNLVLKSCNVNGVKFHIYFCRLFWNCTVSAVGVDAEHCERLDGDVAQRKERLISGSQAVLLAGSQRQTQSGVNSSNDILHPLGLQTRLLEVLLLIWCMCMSPFNFLSHARRLPFKRLTWPLTDHKRRLKLGSSAQGKQAI